MSLSLLCCSACPPVFPLIFGNLYFHLNQMKSEMIMTGMFPLCSNMRKHRRLILDSHLLLPLLCVPVFCNTPPFSSRFPLGFGLLWVTWSLCWCSLVVSRSVSPFDLPSYHLFSFCIHTGLVSLQRCETVKLHDKDLLKHRAIFSVSLQDVPIIALNRPSFRKIIFCCWKWLSQDMTEIPILVSRGGWPHC